MGLGGISIWQLLIILVIIILLFGTKRLKGLGGDIGDAIKGFRKAVSDDKKPESLADQKPEDETKPVEKTDAKSEQK